MSNNQNPKEIVTKSITELVLNGEVTVHSLGELRVRFLAALEGEGPIRLRTRNVTYLDAAALQFLWALRRESEARSRPISFEVPNDTVLKDVHRLGMQDVFRNPHVP